MSKIVKVLPYSIDLGETIKKTELHTLFVKGDKQAHRFELEIKHGSASADLTGCTVTGYFTNFKENTTIEVVGKAEGSKAIVTLSKPCYTLHGQFVLVIQIKSGEVEASIFCGEGYMRASKAEKIVYEDYVIYDVDTLLAQIAEMKTATKDAQDAAAAAITAAGKAPYINAANNHWMVWDAGKSAYVDTGVLATGPEGPEGPPGQNGTGSGTVTAVTVKGQKYEPDQAGNINLGELGGGDVKTVNGVSPDGSGNVQLNAQNVGALPSNGTSVNAEKLGGKAPEYYLQPVNLLDNSDFRNPVNQRNFKKAENAWTYTIDRWQTGSAGTELTNDGIKMAANSWFFQNIDKSVYDKELASGWTAAVCLSTGTILIHNSQGVQVVTEGCGVYFNTEGYADGFVQMRITSGENQTPTLRWAAVYKGVYTAETLPPYVPKGYTVELAECMRYYQPFSIGGERAPAIWNGSAFYTLLITKAYFYSIPMRYNPTVTYTVAQTFNTVDNAWKDAEATNSGLSNKFRCITNLKSSATSGNVLNWNIEGYASADL